MMNNEKLECCDMLKGVIEEFSRLQSYMALVNIDTPVYELMLNRYYELKIILNVCKVDLTNLDRELSRIINR